MLDNLRQKAQEILKNKNLDYQAREKYLLISSILKEDNCFLKMDIDTALSIIVDLGYPMSSAKNIYKSFITKIS